MPRPGHPDVSSLHTPGRAQWKEQPTFPCPTCPATWGHHSGQASGNEPPQVGPSIQCWVGSWPGASRCLLPPPSCGDLPRKISAAVYFPIQQFVAVSVDMNRSTFPTPGQCRPRGECQRWLCPWRGGVRTRTVLGLPFGGAEPPARNVLPGAADAGAHRQPTGRAWLLSLG